MIKIPENKEFIFTIFDDTDVATLENIKPIYDFLDSIGMHTTKTVWPLRCDELGSNFAGSHTLEDFHYASYIKYLAQKGFEISFHGASMESSTRIHTLKALEYFNEILGFYPRTYACHSINKENISWGEKRFKFIVFKKLYQFLFPIHRNLFHGDKKNSPFYWGDICHKYFDFVRTFTFPQFNLLNITNNIVYRSKHTPYLKKSFITCDADNVVEFNNLICEKNQLKLNKQNGICIVSTHFGKGFVNHDKLNETSKKLLLSLSKKNGWFVPVCEVLDFLDDQSSKNYIKNTDLFYLEFIWFLCSLKRVLLKKKYEKTEISYLCQNK